MKLKLEPVVRLPGRLWAFLNARRKVLASALLGAVTILVAIAWFGDPFGKAPTYGMIWVDSPEIYTRERLVNDRLTQDAWLNRQLEGSKGVRDALQVVHEKRDATLGTPAKPADPAAHPPGGNGAANPEPEPRPSSQMQLLVENDYRDLVRSLIIENQLDDRHDLNGNSLYLLKFDASIVPGANTQATALVKVYLSGPVLSSSPVAGVTKAMNVLLPGEGEQPSLRELGDKQHIDAWRTLYRRWVENLRSRLNQAQKELRQSYLNNEFSHNDYARFIGFVGRHFDLTPGSLAECRAQITGMLGQYAPSPALHPEDHAARKRCAEALVRRAIETGATNRPEEGQYIPGTERPSAGWQPAPETSPPRKLDLRAMRVTRELNELLGATFASKTMQLVLGLPVPPSRFLAGAFHDAPELQPLVQLSFFTSDDQGGDDGNAFIVKPKEFNVAAIDSNVVTENSYKKIAESKPALERPKFSDFDGKVATSSHESQRLLTSRSDAARIGEPYVFADADFKPVQGAQGMYVALAEVGLLNFARKARENTRAFTYSVTPKERGDTVLSELSAHSQLQGGLLPGGSDWQAPLLGLGRESAGRTVNRRGAVVGFGGTPQEGQPVEFGWMIGPRQLAADGQRIVYIQGPAQHSLSALVSIPSWWDRVKLKVSTSWIGRDGKPVPFPSSGSHQPDPEFWVDVPADFEPLETTLLEVQQLGPELMESRLEPVRLTACRSGAIIIPGRRLWRSTRVTVGYQTANEISVLPNMKGIIAKFDMVQNQMNMSEAKETKPDSEGNRDIRRAIRVWTSQGTITLPSAAWIEIPKGGCKDQNSKPAVS